MIRAAVLTISDRSFRRERPDVSGPAIGDLCARHDWRVLVTDILPDEQAAISSRLVELADSSGIDVILTTGGTGVAPRDVTPEATRSILHREIPGLGELMRAEGLKSTRYAPLSRSLAGIRGSTLIVNLPGSPKGAVESLNAIVGLVPHIVRLLAGETGHPD